MVLCLRKDETSFNLNLYAIEIKTTTQIAYVLWCVCLCVPVARRRNCRQSWCARGVESGCISGGGGPRPTCSSRKTTMARRLLAKMTWSARLRPECLSVCVCACDNWVRPHPWRCHGTRGCHRALAAAPNNNKGLFTQQQHGRTRRRRDTRVRHPAAHNAAPAVLLIIPSPLSHSFSTRIAYIVRSISRWRRSHQCICCSSFLSFLIFYWNQLNNLKGSWYSLFELN